VGDDQSSSHGEGTLNGSRIGFKGVEDLGGGLAADFQIEMGLFPSEKANAQTTSPLRNRNSWVGLTGGFGNVLAGRIYTPVWATQASYDAGGNNGMYGWNGGLTGSGNRQANAVQYTSPLMNGLQAKAMLGFGQTMTDSTVASGLAGNAKLDEVSSLGLSYANGPISAHYAYEKTKNHTFHDLTLSDTKGTALAAAQQLVGVAAAVTAPNAAPNTTVNALGASYNLGVAKVNYVWNEMKIDNDTATDLKVTTSGLSASVPFGAATAFASFSDAKNNASTKVKLSGTQFGAIYDLSKRTALYAIVGNNKLTSGETTIKFASSAFGVRHSF